MLYFASPTDYNTQSCELTESAGRAANYCCSYVPGMITGFSFSLTLSLASRLIVYDENSFVTEVY